MRTRLVSSAAWAVMLLLSAPSFAQKFEAVHAINFNSSAQAEAALGTLMQDPAMQGARVTLYAQTFGAPGSSHLVVADFNGYGDYMKLTERRLASHGWSQYLLRTTDSEYQGSNLIMVLDDHGAPRHEAGYLTAYLIHTTDPATYRSAIADLDEAIGNPGVLRLVAMRTGDFGYTHAVLIGGADFKAVNEYLDKLYASDAFAEFARRVGATRKVVAVNMYRRIATWGD